MQKVLTEGFSSFLGRHRLRRHFERGPLLDALVAAPSPSLEPGAVDVGALVQDLLTVAQDDPAAALVRLNSQVGGLDSAEAARRLVQVGPNEVAHEPLQPGWLHFWHCYLNPFNVLLTVLAALSFISSDTKATVVIGTMVMLSTVIRFVQEGRSHRAADSLRAMVSNKATVFRRNVDTAQSNATKPQEIAMRELVAGDVVALSAGDIIPADCRVLTARDLFVAQSAMTGESLPVEKFVQA